MSALLDALEAAVPGWHRDALCLEHPEVNFFPERGEDARPAKALCTGCLVAGECLGYALRHGIEEGVWGGRSGRERRQIRSAKRAA